MCVLLRACLFPIFKLKSNEKNAMPAVALLLVGPSLPERSKVMTQTKRDTSLLEGFRWQPHHQARVLWAKNLHTLN